MIRKYPVLFSEILLRKYLTEEDTDVGHNKQISAIIMTNGCYEYNVMSFICSSYLSIASYEANKY